MTLALLPLVSIFGFGTLALVPTIAALVAYQVIRRAGNFAFARPTREVLFTVVPREDKYKAKSFIDTVVYRLGDQVGAWSYAGLGAARIGDDRGIHRRGADFNSLAGQSVCGFGRRQKALEAQFHTPDSSNGSSGFNRPTRSTI